METAEVSTIDVKSLLHNRHVLRVTFGGKKYRILDLNFLKMARNMGAEGEDSLIFLSKVEVLFNSLKKNASTIDLTIAEENGNAKEHVPIGNLEFLAVC